MTAAELQEKLTALQATLDRMADAAGRGEPVDLSSISGDVESLCGRVLTLSAPDARALLPGMQRAIEQLDRLAQTLRERQSETKAADEKAARLHAARAYGKAYR